VYITGVRRFLGVHGKEFLLCTFFKAIHKTIHWLKSKHYFGSKEIYFGVLSLLHKRELPRVRKVHGQEVRSEIERE